MNHRVKVRVVIQHLSGYMWRTNTSNVSPSRYAKRTEVNTLPYNYICNRKLLLLRFGLEGGRLIMYSCAYIFGSVAAMSILFLYTGLVHCSQSLPVKFEDLEQIDNGARVTEVDQLRSIPTLEMKSGNYFVIA